MKILKILGIAILGFIIFQNAKAQTPEPVNVYYPEQLESVMVDFFRSNPKDIYAPETAILDAFKKQFPGATDIEWETGNNFYWVNFDIQSIDYDAFYDPKANLVYYQCDIAYLKVPDAVRQTVQERYREMRVDDVNKIVTAAGVQYKVSLEKGEQELDAYFDENGKFLKEKAS